MQIGESDKFESDGMLKGFTYFRYGVPYEVDSPVPTKVLGLNKRQQRFPVPDF